MNKYEQIQTTIKQISAARYGAKNEQIWTDITNAMNTDIEQTATNIMQMSQQI